MRVPVKVTPGTSRVVEGSGFLRGSSNADLQSQASLAASLVKTGEALGSVGGLLREQSNRAQHFGQLQNFTQFQTSVDERLAELKRNANPAQGNFADQADAIYNNMEAEWLKTVPDQFYNEFKTRAATLRADVARTNLAFQYESTDNFFRQGISDKVNQAALSLDQDGSLANLDAQRAAIDDYINASGLTEAEKVEKRRAAYAVIESISYKSEVRKGNLAIESLGVGSAPGTAADLILEFDGASMENGLTYEANVELVNERVREAEAIAVQASRSVDRWAAMPEYTRAALISLADDLGEIPPSVQAAIDSGDVVEVAAAIEALGGKRREAEAAVAAGLAAMPEGTLDADPRFANIPYEDRLALRADAEREVKAQQTAEAAAAKAAQDTAINSLMVNLFDGNAGQYEIDQAREAGVLTKYEDIKQAQDLLDKRMEEVNVLQTALANLQNPTFVWNPDNKDHRDMLNAVVGTQGIEAIQQGNQEFVENVLVPLVRTSKDVPTEVAGTLEGMIRSDDPLRALFALDTLAQLQQASAYGYAARLPEEVEADVAFWQGAKSYMEQEELLAAIRGGTTQEARTRVKMLREEARSLLDDGSVSSVTEVERYVSNLTSTLGDAGGWRWGDPVMEPGQQKMMTSDFQRLFELEYAKDGNQTKAAKRATDRMAMIWKVTDIGGQQTLMRNPPELMGYETWDGSHEWINAQAREMLELPEDGRFQLVADEQTSAEYAEWQKGSGVRPSYLAFYYDENGQLAIPTVKAPDGTDTGVPQRLFFEITPAMQEEKAARFAVEQAVSGYEDFMQTYERAMQHSLKTGIPIPEEIQQDYDVWQERAAAAQGSGLLLNFSSWGAR